MLKVCVICAWEFSVRGPSDKKSTCGPACRSERARRHASKGRPWSDDARARLAAKGETPNLRLGTEAAKRSPVAGRFETNQEAKVWRLVSPEGKRYVVTNLLKWLRDNERLITPLRVEQLYRGLLAVNRWANDKLIHTVSQAHGWRLEAPASEPSDP